MTPALKPKPVPGITWNNTLPPFRDYLYFENCGQVPFEADAEDFSPANAWWLGEAALLAYAGEAFVRPRLRGAGLDRLTFLSGGSTQCYVAEGPRFAIVAFRGTELSPRKDKNGFAPVVADLKADLDIRLVDHEDGGCIHRGFRDALDEVWPALSAHLRDLRERGTPVWMAGHSLGGAVAVLAAARHRDVAGVYTYGTPRVGDRAFVESFPVPVWRFVNNNDVVPHLPPIPYRSIGALRYIDSDGMLHEKIAFWERRIDEIQGHIKCVLDVFDDGLPALMPDGLKDHTPVLYAVHLWNHLVRHRAG